MLSYVREDEVGGDGRHLVEPGLAELALDVVLSVKAVAAEGLHSGVGRLPGSVGGEQQGHIGLCSAGFSPIKEGGGLLHHERGRLDARVRPRYGELDALVLADGPAEDLALLRPRAGFVYKETAVAYALGGYQDALGVHPVEDVAKALSLLADEVSSRHA